MRILLSILTVLLSLTFSAQKKVDWLFMYYMPYDNDLSSFSNLIADELRSAPENVGVTLLMDINDDRGMGLYYVDKGDWVMDSLLGEGQSSGNPQTFETLLRRSSGLFEAEHQALFFLDHAGSLNEVGLDTRPDSTWLMMSDVSPVLERHTRIHGKLDLVYYQVCSKGSLEALYEHADYFEACMASQLVLGAPNYYYKGVFSSLSENSPENGTQLAKLILEHEDSSMYHGVSIIRAETIASLKEQLGMLIGPSSIPPVEIPLDMVKDYQYDGVTYVDLTSLLRYLRKYERWDRKLCKSIRKRIEVEIMHFTGAMEPTFANSLFSGISVCLTPQPQDMKLQFYLDGVMPFVATETKKGR